MRIPIPREHGTWAMLYAPLACAAFSVGHVDLRFVLFLVSTTAAFFSREPIETWFRLRLLGSADRERMQKARTWAMIYAALAALTSGYLILKWQLWLLAGFGLLFALMIPLHLYWVSRRVDRQVLAELTAVAALTASAPACRYSATGSLDAVCWILWALNVLFFASSVFYVKMRVSRVAKKHKDGSALALSLLYHLGLSFALVGFSVAGYLPPLVLLAFVPVVLRAITGMFEHGKLSLTRIGVSEVAFTLVFVIFMVLGFYPS